MTSAIAALLRSVQTAEFNSSRKLAGWILIPDDGFCLAWNSDRGKRPRGVAAHGRIGIVKRIVEILKDFFLFGVIAENVRRHRAMVGFGRAAQDVAQLHGVFVRQGDESGLRLTGSGKREKRMALCQVLVGCSRASRLVHLFKEASIGGADGLGQIGAIRRLIVKRDGRGSRLENADVENNLAGLATGGFERRVFDAL